MKLAPRGLRYPVLGRTASTTASSGSTSQSQKEDTLLALRHTPLDLIQASDTQGQDQASESAAAGVGSRPAGDCSCYTMFIQVHTKLHSGGTSCTLHPKHALLLHLLHPRC